MSRLIERLAGIPWREIPWGLIIVIGIVLAIIGSGFWAAFEIWSRATDGVYGS